MTKLLHKTLAHVVAATLLPAAIAGISPANHSAIAEPVAAFVTMTGGKQGAYYKAARELEAIARTADLKLNVQTSAGSLQNIQALSAGKADLAFIQMDAAALQEKLDKDRSRKVMERIKIFAPVTTEVIHIVVNKRSKIRSIQDLRGKRVSFGPQGSGTSVSASYIYLTLGLSQDLRKHVQFLDTEVSMRKVDRGELDAAFFTAAKGVPLLANFPESADLELLSLSNSEFRQLESSQAGYSLYASDYLPAGTYPWQKKDVLGISTFTFIVARSDLDRDWVYRLAKVVYSQAVTLQRRNPFWKYLNLQQAATDIDGQAPYHPGVIQLIRGR